MSDDERVSNGADAPLSDGPLLDLLDALVESRGKVAAAEALGVNYRTMTNCHNSRRVSRRMRRALQEFHQQEAIDDGGAEVGDDGAADEAGTLRQRVAALEQENSSLREIIEAQAEQRAEWERRSGAVVDEERQRGEADVVDGGDGQRQGWRPPGRDHGLPDAGVVTLEEQPDEEHAFGPAASLVAEWRALRTGAEASGSRVDRARASVRRWELETAMLDDFHLTLPPETEPLDASRRDDHLRWRQEALASARREMSRAKRVRLMRRILTLGLRWK